MNVDKKVFRSDEISLVSFKDCTLIFILTRHRANDNPRLGCDNCPSSFTVTATTENWGYRVTIVVQL